MTRLANPKAWAALLVAAISAATVVAIIGVALLGGDMARAATGSDATIEATPFSVASTQTGEKFAVCPGSKRALGGGVLQGDGFGGSVGASGPLNESGSTSATTTGDIAKKWYAAAVNGSGDQLSFKVFAICSGASDATIVATPFSVEANGQTGEAYAECPASSRALGGGVVQSGSALGLYVRASGPLDATGFTSKTRDGDIAKQWYAAVANFDRESRDFKVFAICSATSNATIEATPFTAESHQSGDAYAKCRAERRALGGGVVESGPPDALIVDASGPLDATGLVSRTRDGDIAKQWYASAANLSGGTVNFKVFAICE